MSRSRQLADDALPWRSGMAYGLLGLPLAFAALPLYVVLPNYYALQFNVSLSVIGGALMAVRLLDACIEPWLGRASDALYARNVRVVLWVCGGVALLHWLGMAGLFFPPVAASSALVPWMVGGMVLTCVAHGLLVIAHQAWGVRLGGDALLRSSIVAWREGLGLVGVIAASALSVMFGAQAMLAVLGCALLVGWSLWWHAPRPEPSGMSQQQVITSLWLPLTQARFRRLLAVFVCNGIASAIPAALMLFFAQDVLRASEEAIAAFLVLYFLCGAASMPVWLRMVRQFGLARSWLVGMLLAVLCFAWTVNLGAGETSAFALICALTGMALGADLALPGAMLARLIERQGAQGRDDGVYLGWWSLATKLNLALAAGITLPLLQWLGYTPGSQDTQALTHLAWAYAWVPCVLKLVAAALLYALIIRQQSGSHTVRRTS